MPVDTPDRILPTAQAPTSRPAGAHTARRSGRTLRGVLRTLLLLPLVPLLAVSGFVVWSQWQSHRDAVYAALTASAAAVAVAVDQEVEIGHAILNTLAASEYIDRGDWASFHRLATEAIRQRPDNWIAIGEPSGRQPVRTFEPYGSPVFNPAPFARSNPEIEWSGRKLPVSTQGLGERVLRSGLPSNTGVYYGATLHKPSVSIAVPVMRKGEVTHVLFMGFTPDRLARLISQARGPDKRAALVDATGRIIARSREPDRSVGLPVVPDLLERISAAPSGVREGNNTDGEATVSAFMRASLTDWTVVIGSPRAVAFAPAWRGVATWTALALALLAVSGWAARTLWLRLAPPLTALGSAAHRIRQGDLPDLPDSRIIEIDRLRDLLRDAAAAEARNHDEALRRAIAEESARSAREAADAQARSQARFRQAIEHFPYGVVLYDTHGRVEYVNGWAQDLLGRDRAALTGLRDEDLWPAEASREMLPALRRTIDTCSVNGVEWATGERFGGRTFAITYAPLCDDAGDLVQVLAITQDITERRLAETVRAASEAQLRRVLDNLDSFVGVLDLEGTLLETNRLPLDRAGITRAQVIGRPYWTAPWWDDDSAVREQLQDAIARAARGESVRYDVAVRVTGLERIAIDFRIAPLRDDGGTITHLVASGLDVTERKRTEAALRAADRQKDEFLAILSHELRNPLAPMRSAAHIIKLRAPDDPVVMQARDVIERQLKQMVRLVDDLLEVARITQGRIELRRRRVALSDVVSSAVEAARPGIEAAGHTLELAPADACLVVDADPARLSQALLNVLQNAARYTPDGGHITLATACRANKVEIVVRDDGIGIAVDALPRIFGMFVQGERASRGGLGIGLALARQLVEMHAGTIAAHSDGPGKGSTFTIELPLAPGPLPASAPAAEAAACASRHVLIIDDNADAAASLQQMLALQGHRVRTACSGEEGLEAVGAERPDLLLVDIGLPGIDGIEVARRLRARLGADCPRLVALSGWGQAADRQRSAGAGFELHLTKPVEPETLAALLAEVPGSD
jgi:PAS domain S-box-containing protein